MNLTPLPLEELELTENLEVTAHIFFVTERSRNRSFVHEALQCFFRSVYGIEVA